MFRLSLLLLMLAVMGCASRRDLPRPASFDASRYLGRWFELARLPVFYQPADALAVAEYGESPRSDVVTVHNRSVSRDGEILNEIVGKATAAKGPPPGRFIVSFPGIPAIVASLAGPNYHVVWVDEGYTRAIVGNPARSNLWILSRKAPLPDAELQSLIQRAREAGFNADRLIIAPWSESAIERFEAETK